MAENVNSSSLGKKVFFLHPSMLIQNQVISELAQEEFEVYIVKDEEKLRRLLNKYPDSIVFASINEGMKENAWEEYIRGIMENSETAKVQIGVIVSSLLDESIKSKYTEQLKVQCGFTIIKSDFAAAVKQLSAILNGANAKGRRKYIRMEMDHDPNATVNLSLDGTYVNGLIRDISVVGFSCSFAQDPELIKNSLFGDMQLKLQAQLLKAEGIVFGSRMDGIEKVYVILFTPRVDPSVRTKIRSYIQTHLQNRMDQELR